LCLISSLHQACPVQVFHHRTVLQYPPFAQRKIQPVILANCCLRWMVHSQWPTCRKPPLPQTSSRYFSHSPSGTPFISLSAKNMLLVSICSNCHVSPHCGYCKSLLEASKRRDHRKFKKKKQNTSTQQLHNHFLWTASSHHSSAQSCTHHITLATGIRSQVTQAAQNMAFGQFPSHALWLAYLTTQSYFLLISMEVTGSSTHKAKTQFTQP